MSDSAAPTKFFIYMPNGGPDDGVEYIDANTMDSLGNYLRDVIDDGSADYILIDTYEGPDSFGLYVRDAFGEFSNNNDTLDIFGGNGNDTLDAPWQDNVLLSGGGGSDVLSAWFSGGEVAWPGGPVTMTGGEDADIFRSASFKGGDVVITDYEIGVDKIMVMSEGESWEALNLSQPGTRFTAEDTDAGVVLHILHHDWNDASISWEVSTITLQGLTVAELASDSIVGAGSVLSGTSGVDKIRNGFDGGLTERVDTIDAGAGNDNIRLDTSNDVILAGTGNDYVLVRGSGNIIDGGAGNDQILTRWGGNTVNGGDGNDRITVDLRSGGEFSLAGGYGSDTFIFTGQQAKAGADIEITDFERGYDHLIIGGVEIDLSDLPDNIQATDYGSSMLLEFGRNDTVLLTFESIPV